VARLLPGALAAPAMARCLIAEGERAGEFLGAACCRLQRGAGGAQTATFRLSVPDESQIPEIVPLLVAACVAGARADGAAFISHEGMLPEESPVAELLAAQGFMAAQVLTEYHMDGRKGFEACDRVIRHFQRHGTIPPDAQVIPLSEAPHHPVHNLIQRYLGTPHGIDPRAPGSNTRGDISTVVRVPPRVVGAVIVREIDGDLEAPYDVVDERFRNSWVTGTMWHRSFRAGLEAGFTRVRFLTGEEQFPKFASFARRMQSSPGRNFARYALRLEA
jgi:hypothetical protein